MTKTNPFKAGSRKAAIYDVFMAAKTPEAGLSAAYKEAANLGIKAGTVKSWSGSWAKGTLPTPKPKGDKAVKRERLPGAESDDDIHFRHSSMFKANQDLDAICKRAGLRPHAFHILENEGKFAVVPALTRPNGPPPQFSKGDVVYDAHITNSKAKVIEAGPQQSMIRYAKESTIKGLARPREQAVPNRYLIKLPDEPTGSKKVKREKL